MYSLLERVEFRSTGSVANDVTYTEVTAGAASVLQPCVSPQPCHFDGFSAADMFVDASGDLGTASGACTMLARGVGQCSTVFPPDYPDLPIADVDHFQIDIALGAGNDRFVADRPINAFLNFRNLELSVDAGTGRDTVIALDSSYHFAGGPFDEAVGVDRVDCGSGIDIAIVSPSVTATNCERVTVIQQFE